MSLVNWRSRSRAEANCNEDDDNSDDSAEDDEDDDDEDDEGDEGDGAVTAEGASPYRLARTLCGSKFMQRLLSRTSVRLAAERRSVSGSVSKMSGTLLAKTH
jgi:hypothetical protein